jgi:hypothetical protein
MKYKIKKDTDFDKVVNQLRQKYCYMSEYEELINDIIIATKEVNALFPSEETENNNNYIPYGEEWKKEMEKLPKKIIIDLFSKTVIKLIQR